MGINWAGTYHTTGDLPEEDRTLIRELLSEFADDVEAALAALGLPLHASPLGRKPWDATIIVDAEKVLVAFCPSPGGGITSIRWLGFKHEVWTEKGLIRAIREELRQKVVAVVTLPLPGSPNRRAAVNQAAQAHARQTEREERLRKLGDLDGVLHLEPYLREFLADHPDPSRTVFVMMRFLTSPQLDEVHAAIKSALDARGLTAVRADDRDYTGELWSNIEVYMTCSRFGIAVFEDIERRDFNPNVSLELGYMLGRRKRCLILKEKRLPDLPADVVHRLYKPFDMFNVTQSVTREVGRWLDVDLGLSLPTA